MIAMGMVQYVLAMFCYDALLQGQNCKCRYKWTWPQAVPARHNSKRPGCRMGQARSTDCSYNEQRY